MPCGSTRGTDGTSSWATMAGSMSRTIRVRIGTITITWPSASSITWRWGRGAITRSTVACRTMAVGAAPVAVAGGGGPVNADWISIGGGDGFVCQVDPLDPDQIYSESQGGATTRMNLRTGERSFMRARPPRGTTYRFNWKTPFILSPHNSKVYYIGRQLRVPLAIQGRQPQGHLARHHPHRRGHGQRAGRVAGRRRCVVRRARPTERSGTPRTVDTRGSISSANLNRRRKNSRACHNDREDAGPVDRPPTKTPQRRNRARHHPPPNRSQRQPATPQPAAPPAEPQPAPPPAATATGSTACRTAARQHRLPNHSQRRLLNRSQPAPPAEPQPAAPPAEPQPAAHLRNRNHAAPPAEPQPAAAC